MRVIVLPADEQACGWYRMALPAGVVGVQHPDWQIDMYRPGDVKLGTGADGKLWQVQGIHEPHTADLVIMQRVATKAQVDLIHWFQRQGVAVVVDADDAMWCLDRDNAAWKAWNGSPHMHWRYLDAAMEIADLVTVTTPTLARRYGKHGRVEVLPNCVPDEMFTQLLSVRDEVDPTRTIGWAGTTRTHPGDLTVVGDAVQQVALDTGCVVRVIGDVEGAARDWGLLPQLVSHVQSQPLGMPYYIALTMLDIGLVPLKANRFNAGKSYLKALEYAACGVAVVATPTQANRDLAHTVPGIHLVRNPAEWQAALLQEINRPSDQAAELKAAAQDAVRQHHTYEVNGHRWAMAWQRAVNRRARMSA